jgi:hypothetical protein
MRTENTCLDNGHKLEIIGGALIGMVTCQTCGKEHSLANVLNWYFNKLDGLLNRIPDSE